MTELITGTQVFHVLKSLALVLFIFFICVAIYNILKRKWDGRHFHQKSKQLVIKESLILDTKRRLVRIQNRHVEHLLLLGSSADLVIESYPVESVPNSAENYPLEKK